MAASSALNEEIKQHYTRSDLGTEILTALAKAGKDVNNLQPEDLAPIDEFHIRGRKATFDLAAAAGLDESKYVLDVGCGIGGPSRCIASAFGCRVIGIDLTDEYCCAATMLAERTGLSHLVSYRQGDALELLFPDETFDVVWTQHVAMNIPDKATLYREMYRVLKPGGVLAIYDVLAGPAAPVIFPVPWARVPETSFLVTPEELREHLQRCGFTIRSWEDNSAVAGGWFASLAKRIQETGLPQLGINVLLGQDFQGMSQNLRRNIDESRVVIVQVVAGK